MHAREIIQMAYLRELVPWHLHGPTQDKTLQARLSEDIAYHPEGSRFFRTAPGIFFLRALLDDPTTPAQFKETYFAKPRRKELRRERVLTFDRLGASSPVRAKFIDLSTLRSEFDAQRYRFIQPDQISAHSDKALAHSFVIIFKGNSVLSYRSGRFFPEIDPTRGMRSVGLGGAVYVTDRDLLFYDMFGIVSGGINEMAHGVGLSKTLAERARYENQLRLLSAVQLPRTELRPAIIQVVLGYRCPAEFSPTKAALSINDLRWIEVGNLSSQRELDETSNLLVSAGALAKFSSEMIDRG